MKPTRLALLCLIAPIATQTCLAASVEQFGTTHIYGMLDNQGIPMFTDIPPVAELPTPAEAPTQQGKPRAKSASASEPARHPAGAHTSEPAANHLADATPPLMRDGGAPPDDH